MSDLIERQAAIDALDALCDRECEYSKKQRSVMCGACHLGSAFDVIEQLQSADLSEILNEAHNEGYDVGYWAGRRDYEPRWIPVTERLPKAGVRYQVTFESGEVGYADFRNKVFLSNGLAKENVWDIEPYYEEDGEVIAWMPLSKPYKEGEYAEIR